MIPCHTCWQSFPDYKALALHIMASGGKCKGKRFASHVLAGKNNKKEFSPRTPMTEETKQKIKDCVRVLSGESEKVRTVCPHCMQVSEREVEVEYLQDKHWRNSNGTLITFCQRCIGLLNIKRGKAKIESDEL